MWQLEKNQYPCKHFYAIFNFFDEWGFLQSPILYKNSVFITFDKEHLSTVQENIKVVKHVGLSAHDGNGSEVDRKSNIETKNSDLDSVFIYSWHWSLVTTRGIGMEMFFKKLSNHSRNKDGNVLQDATSAIDAIIANAQKHWQRQDGLPLRQSPDKRS